MILLLLALLDTSGLWPPDVFVVRPQTNSLTYRIYYGPTPGNYTNKFDAGTNLQVTVGFSRAGTRYMAAVSVDTKGAESDFSNEITVTNQSVTVAWDAPHGTNYVTPGLVLQAGPGPTGPFTDAFYFPAFTLTNPTAKAMFYRARVTITNQ